MRWRSLIVAVLVASAAPVLAADERDTVYAVAQRVIAGFDSRDLHAVREATWPDGYHSITRRDRGSELLKRHWADVANHGLGLNFETRFGRPAIAVHGDRAEVDVRYAYRMYYASDTTPSECGNGTYRFDLRRRGGEWRVLNLTGTIDRASARCG